MKRDYIKIWNTAHIFYWMIVFFIQSCSMAGAAELPEVAPTTCMKEYGLYMSIAPNGDIAVDHCSDGIFGVLLRTKEGVRRFVPKNTKYVTSTFSPDGSVLIFTEIDWSARSSSVHMYDLRTKKLETIYSDKGLISHAAITSDRKVLYFWNGQFRESGKTIATDFLLRRLNLGDGKVVLLDGPYFGAYPISVDRRGGVYYSCEKNDIYQARRIQVNSIQPENIELRNLNGKAVYTDKGYYYTVRFTDKYGYYIYCIKGPGIRRGEVCPGKAFALTVAGDKLMYVTKADELITIELK